MGRQCRHHRMSFQTPLLRLLWIISAPFCSLLEVEFAGVCDGAWRGVIKGLDSEVLIRNWRGIDNWSVHYLERGSADTALAEYTALDREIHSRSKGLTLYQDKDSAHNSKATHEWAKRNSLSIITGPGKSPDFSISKSQAQGLKRECFIQDV
jgi:hypothetical protein